MIKSVELNDGNKLPMIGLGTWQLQKNDIYNTLLNGIQLGYKLIDCADLYDNEIHIGTALNSLFQQNIIKRESLFITSKIWGTNMYPNLIIPTLKKQLKSLQLNYLDLYLMHGPIVYHHDPQNERNFFPLDTNTNQMLYPKKNISFLDSWKEMEKAVKLGLVKSIGVSHFNINQIEKILNICNIKPTVNQCEYHPFIHKQQIKLIKYCESKQIIFQGFSPFGCAEKDGPLFDENIKQIAIKYKKYVVQILIKFCIQNNIPTVFKSSKSERLKQNIQINDFIINKYDMNKLMEMNKNWRYVWNENDKNHRDYPFAPKYPPVAMSNYNDKNLQQESKLIVSSLNTEELNRLKSKLDNDIKQNNSQYDPQLYQYLSNIINDDNKQDSKDILEVKTDSQNTDKKEESETKLETKMNEAQPVNEMKEEKEITYKLQDIIQRKDEEIQRMIAINNEQTELIKSLSEENIISDTDINQCLNLINKLVNNLIKSFDIKYNINNINEMGENNINNLVDINSEFNIELNKYKEILKTIGICSNKLNNSIDNIKGYINDKYIPNENDYKQWKLNDILLWIKVLENGRYIKYLDVLSIGFKESEILNGEILPDLNTADLAVTPFNIKKFRDRRDLIKNFKRLSGQ